MDSVFQRLAPYLVPQARRGVVGSSRYAKALREQLRLAANNKVEQPVLLMGEPGLEKDNLAALIHFSSAQRRLPLIRLDGALLRADGAELFGMGHPSLLECLNGGTLLIDKFDKAPPALQTRLLELGDQHQGRLILTSETALPALDSSCFLIRVPPLRVRRQDLGEWLRYGIRQRSRKLGWAKPPSLAPGIVERLQQHDFPNNIRELEELIYRALQQAKADLPEQLPEDVFWTASRGTPARFDLWRWKPQLRFWLRSPRLWNVLLFGLMSWLFVLVNLWLWLGPQDRAHNGALNLFWAWWWPLILLGFPFVGRLWCSFCPFMVWGEISQRVATRIGWQPARWPRGNTDRWASPLLAAGFAAILLWEELGAMESSPWLSSCLLLVITAGAVLGSLAFEKRFWCRYLCPVGGMNGLFAKLSILELRAQAGTCSGSCSSYACFKGGSAEGEGLATSGCPLGTHPAHLSDNRNCVLCLTCAQACAHRSVQLNLRPPAADLQRQLAVPTGEPALILVLAGGVVLHHWQQSAANNWPLALGYLALPGLIGLVFRCFVSGQQWRHGLYGMLPLLWALLLARHLPLGMGEAGMLLPVSFGDSWPGWSADSHVLAFCQSAVLIVGVAGSLLLLRRLLLGEGRLLWLTTALTVVLGLGGRWLVA